MAAYIGTKSGRPVHIANVSDGGTTRDIVQKQLPKVDLTSTDVVIVADSMIWRVAYRSTSIVPT